MRVNITFAQATALIGILLIILGGMFALGRYIRTDRIEALEHEVATLKESKDWKLPETLESLNQVSDKVRSQIEEMQKVEALRTENEALQSDNNKLTERVETLAKQNANLEAEIRQNIASVETFTRSEGGTVSLVKNSVRMGLDTIYSDSVEFNLENEPRSLDIGNDTSFTYADKKCTITLVEIKYFVEPETAKFSYGCT